MKKFSYVLAVLLGLSVMVGVSGCYKRPVYVEDNTTHNVTLLDVQKVGALFGTVYKHTYMLCTDTGDVINCKPLCGTKGLDYKCPSIFNGQMPWNRFATNVRKPVEMAAAPAAAPEAAPAPEATADAAAASEEVTE